jgi:5-oxoprolinase (ATP-hydrolysing) subunit A
MTRTIDLNCDMGESYGAWTMGQDAAVMPWITSANIACGFHGGDPDVMRATLALAKQHGVAVGAHVSLPDLQGFGRREMRVTPDEAYAFTLYQIGALTALARAQALTLRHVKPHGALYNMAARDAMLAAAIARAVRDADAALILVGLADSALTRAGIEAGITVAHEAFADRRYEPDGTLTPRREPDAVIHDPLIAAAQVTQLLEHGEMTSRTGAKVRIACDTICVHGDRPDAASFARTLRETLAREGVTVRALADPSA